MSDRRRRDEPERTGPIRGGFFSASSGNGTGEAPERDASEGRQSGPKDPFTAAVELGYKVVDDYMRQGQAAARRMGDRPPAGLPLGRDLTDLTTRWFEYTTRMAEVWFQFVGMTGAGPISDPRGSPTGARPAGSPPTAAPGASAPDRVSVAIECSRPVEVSVDLRATPQTGTLIAHRLRTVNPNARPIGGVSVVRDDAQRFTIRIRVDEDQPTGTYSGLVVDEATNLPVGSISVYVP